MAQTAWAGHDAQLHPTTLATDIHAGQVSSGRQGLSSRPTVQYPSAAPALPRVLLAPPLIRACEHPTHMHVALLVAYELRRQGTAHHRRHPRLCVAVEARPCSRVCHVCQHASPGLATEGPRGRALNLHLGSPLLENRRERMGVQDSALLGGRQPAFPSTLNEAGREHWRLDYTKPRGLTWSDDNHIGIPAGHGGDHTDRHYSRRHERDPMDNTRANRYEQRHGGDPRGWLREEARRGCTRGAHLLVGNCPRQTFGSGDRGPLALDRVDAPSSPGRWAPAWGLRVEHTPMFRG
ncbi:hypothetical protein D1007_33412 [Hordeum vulgare]|nr:hypothetical protein D1007_33412 [Hordeum vulgare]